jgi:YfiR/HmsC-like
MSDRPIRMRGALWRDVLRAVVQVGAMVASGLMLVCRASPGAAATDAVTAGELDVKAAFVLNFIRLVNWSNVAEEANQRELPVCACVKSEFFTAVRSVAAGKTAGSRSIVFKIEPDPDVRRCRVLLVDRAHYQSARQVLRAIKDAPILTVGNGAGLLDGGGMFELIVLDGKVQFDVGLEAIRRSGLDISARLLHLARNLRTGGNGVN